jgi:hypothetical protein
LIGCNFGIRYGLNGVGIEFKWLASFKGTIAITGNYRQCATPSGSPLRLWASFS